MIRCMIAAEKLLVTKRGAKRKFSRFAGVGDAHTLDCDWTNDRVEYRQTMIVQIRVQHGFFWAGGLRMKVCLRTLGNDGVSSSSHQPRKEQKRG